MVGSVFSQFQLICSHFFGAFVGGFQSDCDLGKRGRVLDLVSYSMHDPLMDEMGA